MDPPLTILSASDTEENPNTMKTTPGSLTSDKLIPFVSAPLATLVENGRATLLLEWIETPTTVLTLTAFKLLCLDQQLDRFHMLQMFCVPMVEAQNRWGQFIQATKFQTRKLLAKDLALVQEPEPIVKPKDSGGCDLNFDLVERWARFAAELVKHEFVRAYWKANQVIDTAWASTMVFIAVHLLEAMVEDLHPGILGPRSRFASDGERERSYFSRLFANYVKPVAIQNAVPTKEVNGSINHSQPATVSLPRPPVISVQIPVASAKKTEQTLNEDRVVDSSKLLHPGTIAQEPSKNNGKPTQSPFVPEPVQVVEIQQGSQKADPSSRYKASSQPSTNFDTLLQEAKVERAAAMGRLRPRERRKIKGSPASSENVIRRALQLGRTRQAQAKVVKNKRG